MYLQPVKTEASGQTAAAFPQLILHRRLHAMFCEISCRDSERLQKRGKEGFSDSMELWGIGQKLHEERATAERLRVLTASARYQLASYAGGHWKVLLAHLEGEGKLGPNP